MIVNRSKLNAQCFTVISLIPVLFSMASRAEVTGVEAYLYPAHYRLTYDSLQLPQHEQLGLAGINYLFDTPYGFNAGLGIYGAVIGDRGGFFTGGFELGYSVPLVANINANAGFFAGGGGGGSAPQGGGLMLRPHAEVFYRAKPYQIGAGISQVRFPNGAINSRQFSFSIEKSFDLLEYSGWDPMPITVPANSVFDRRFQQRQFMLSSTSYYPFTGNKGRSGKLLEQRADLIGVRWRQQLNRPWWGEFETSGAWGGQVDGFAQVAAGASRMLWQTDALAVYGGALFGAAGGGDIDTDGGTIVRIFGGLQVYLLQNWLLDMDLGLTSAIEGSFNALTLNTAFSYRYRGFTSFVDTDASANEAPILWRRHRVRVDHQHYALSGHQRKSGQLEGVDVDLIGLKLDTYMLPQLFVTGQAYGAYDGGAGGYAVGLLGFGYEVRYVILRPVYWSAEIAIGAAGGGGISVGSGTIAQPVLNFGVNLTKSIGMTFGLGRVVALNGALNAPIVDLSLNYQFSLPYKG